MPRLTIEPDGMGGYKLVEHGFYGRSSVLAGQPKRTTRLYADTAEALKADYPEAEVLKFSGHSIRSPMGGDPGPLAPSWFDPADAGERWDDEDY